MLNVLHALLHSPARGWDPVSAEHVEHFAREAWLHPDFGPIDRLENLLGSLSGRRVLDLGGGPGVYSVEFARRGAAVYWHDVSRRYEAIARDRADKAGVGVHYSIGYLESACGLGVNTFDIVFSRLCWNYSRSDFAFARLLYTLVKPGGLGYVLTNTSSFERPSGVRALQYQLYIQGGVKIGHPFPPRGLVRRHLANFDMSSFASNSQHPDYDEVYFTKAGGDLGQEFVTPWCSVRHRRS